MALHQRSLCLFRSRSAFGLTLIAWSFPVVLQSQTWTRTGNSPPSGVGTALLLTDGTVIAHVNCSGTWHKLTPDSSGSYINGTWSTVAPMPAGYGPLYYASAVLSDGRVIVIGGEYNGSGCPFAFTNRGAVYNPVTNAWVDITPTSPFAAIGDASSTVLPNGKFLLASPLDTRLALLDPATMLWSNPGSTGKADRHDEENWTLLPDGRILAADALSAPNSEIYNPATGVWTSAGSSIVNLTDGPSQEIGPAVLRPDGTVFATGATGHNSVYRISTGTWTPAPDFPTIAGQGVLDVADGPASLLPSGNVLVAASPGVFHAPTHFFEYNGSTLTEVASPPRATADPSFAWRFLLLPTGQVMATDGSNDVEIYTSGGTFNNAWRPIINVAPTAVVAGQTYTISGVQFNGLSQGAYYGDDAQMATNYPLVRIKNRATGHVQYARTHDHSSMGVATGSAVVSTKFDAPAGLETGPADLVVVANGIPSPSVLINGCAVPEITNVSATPNRIWPPTQKMVDVAIAYTVTSACSSSCVLSVSSNEPGPGQWSIVDAHHVQLKADRDGSGTGRVYTNTITCTNSTGPSTRTVVVTVPHDQDQ